MIKTIKNTIVGLFLFFGLITTPPLKASSLSSMQLCEGLSATLAASGSYFEYALHKDDSKKADVVRLLISMARIVHGGLVLYNHDKDYNPYHTAWLAADIGHFIGRIGAFIGDGNVLFEKEEITEIRDLAPEMVEKLAATSSVLLPVLEAMAGLVITFSTEQTEQAKKIRFVAQSMLSFSRLGQTILRAEGTIKKALITLFIMHCGHVLYQVLREDSQFNVWMSVLKEPTISRQELRAVLDGRVGGITCVRGHYDRRLTAAEIAELERGLEADLTARGLRFIRADGYYNGGHIPNSYIILDIGEAEMVGLANRFAQASVIVFNNGQARLITLREPNNNRVYVADGWAEVPDARQDCTLVRTTDGDFRFTYNFNFARV